ncbi:MAG: hypothetical protein JW936_01220, partial [Sedimentisphaerales bacterium]|nr:hypothetical protein [Sedimentisphaerales bacterium]
HGPETRQLIRMFIDRIEIDGNTKTGTLYLYGDLYQSYQQTLCSFAVRGDSLPYRRQIEVIRGMIEDRLLRPITRERLRLLRLDPALMDDPTAQLPYQILWSDRGYDDQYKEANAAKIKLETNTTNLAIECAKDGRDYRKVIEQSGKIKKLMKKHGLIEQPPKPPAAPKQEQPKTDGQADEQSQENNNDAKVKQSA